MLLTTHNTRYFQEADQIHHLKDGKIIELKVDDTQTGLQELVRRNEKISKDNEDECNEYKKENDNQTMKQVDEEREGGRVAFKVYKEYCLYGSCAVVCFIVALVYVSGQGKKNISFWLLQNR